MQIYYIYIYIYYIVYFKTIKVNFFFKHNINEMILFVDRYYNLSEVNIKGEKSYFFIFMHLFYIISDFICTSRKRIKSNYYQRRRIKRKARTKIKNGLKTNSAHTQKFYFFYIM